ncbi:tubulin-folding cofactor A [Physcomitrium patens]|uniref:Tubulin-specific chaperone A n=1 Tax=Physcomitrium patens TaxID=3218 RepID=A0A2K1K7F2_PHYPA|nr:hypothetical protein PHYPA_011607 [Physcomitrium patens]
MATMKNLKIKTGVCKRLMKELQSYQSEADKECIKAKNMRRSHADPFDIKQQEHVVAESCLTISNCRKRLETALATLEAAVVDAEAQSTAGESEELSAASELIAQVKPLFIA